jgi:hypothetical protein
VPRAPTRSEPFELDDHDLVLVKMFSSPNRGDTAWSPVPPELDGDRIFLRINADAADEELDEMAEAIVDWIEAVCPGFVLPDED